jgi:hypothetical protein
VFAGSDVLSDGVVTIYLHDVSSFGAVVDGATQAWTVRRLRTG